MSDIEKEIHEKGLTAPRVTPKDIEGAIFGENYFTAGDAAEALGQPAHESMHLLTFCVLTLRNGFTVTGESACASPENFDEEIGRKIARQNAVNKIWPLLGYALRSRLHAGPDVVAMIGDGKGPGG
jgi:Phage protein (N4 Gp49/phage Sf6 gene 66) family